MLGKQSYREHVTWQTKCESGVTGEGLMLHSVY